jgi:transketolase
MLSLAKLNDVALNIRRSIITMLETAGSGHSGGALGMTDVFTSLYFAVTKHDPQNPTWSDRDHILVSNGHICPVWYATLAEAGYFPKEELSSLRQLNSRLQGHPHLGSLPGVENTSGPLGQGFSQACGLAYALKKDGKPNRVYCILSDGEQNEGQTWEAYMFAAKNKLDNLTIFIDRNHIQIDGYTEDVMPLEPLKTKIESFGWHCLEVDGHNIEAVVHTINMSKAIHEQPSAIICHTIPGKGVDFMENLPAWHGKPPNHEQAAAALKQLRSLCGQYWCE